MRKFACLAAGALVLLGCGRQERREAASLCRMLSQKQTDMASVDGLEKNLRTSVGSWCEGIVQNGGGKSKQLQENAESAKTMAFSAGEIATQLSHVRQTLYDLTLHEEYPQSVRSGLVNQMMQRQKKLQEIRAALESSAAGFQDFARSRTYAGDSYPAAIDRLNTLVSRAIVPEDALDKAIRDLKAKYRLTDVDLAGRT